MIEALAKIGYQVVPEVARSYIESQIAAGKNLHDVVKDQITFQRIVLNQMLEIERQLDQQKLVFFDRALPDGIGYYRYAGLDPDEVFALCRAHSRQYRQVFFFDAIPLAENTTDHVRRENEQESLALGDAIRRGYIELEYDLIPVPVLPLEERLSLILHHALNHDTQR